MGVREMERKKHEAAEKILRMKKEREAMEAEYAKVEAFLIANMTFGEEIHTKSGNVDLSTTKSTKVDAEALSKQLPFDEFVKSVNVSISGVKHFLSLEELAAISTVKVFDRLNVQLKKTNA